MKGPVWKQKRKMCAVVFAMFLWLVGVTLPRTVFAEEAFQITAYHIEMDVHEDNSYHITETLDVSYSEQRHGIIRSLPLQDYRGQQIEISDVDVEGHPFKYSKKGKDLEIKIGDPNRFAEETERYVLTYTWHGRDDKLKDMDELYFNLVGVFWDCTIENVSFVIHMPKAFDDQRMRFTYGGKGSKREAPLDLRVSKRTIEGELLTSLSPKEGLTIALPLPQGYFSGAPKGTSWFSGGFSGSPMSGLEMIGWIFSLVLGVLGTAAWTAGARKQQIFPTVEFYPPEGINSADAGYLMDEEVDSFDITSLIIYWADRGYLWIQEQKEKKIFGTKTYFVLSKLKEMGPEAKEYEREMFEELFQSYGDGHCVSTKDLEMTFYPTVESAKRGVEEQFSGQYQMFSPRNKIFKWGLRLCAFVMCAAVLMMIYPRAEMLEDGNNKVLTLSVALVMVILLQIPVTLIKEWKRSKKNRLGGIIGSLFAVGGTVAQLCLAKEADRLLQLSLCFAVIILLLILSSRCERRTPLGQQYLEYLTGFKQFLQAAEEDRIRMLVNENPWYFYHILPYAVVLGVTNVWAKHFDAIALQPPNWYTPADGYYDNFQASSFARDLGGSLGVISNQMNSRPSSSDNSSGGGSSGGGSGGGGGSSW